MDIREYLQRNQSTAQAVEQGTYDFGVSEEEAIDSWIEMTGPDRVTQMYNEWGRQLSEATKQAKAIKGEYSSKATLSDSSSKLFRLAQDGEFFNKVGKRVGLDDLSDNLTYVRDIANRQKEMADFYSGYKTQEEYDAAAAKAKELETEKMVLNAQLAESRISTMMSQIRPHFIYNTLGSIEQLCELDPPKAGELVHNFAKYLRGNFGELDNPKPILMSQEMEHVHHYINIENVRFPDMTFSFEMKSEDFSLPALTVQPIVENAIKHGLMKLQKGGSIRVISYETDTDYCISVEDDGVGFDTSKLLDEKKHIGIRNIRDRLKVMVGGTLEIESTQGVGTKVLITIPKEEKK